MMANLPTMISARIRAENLWATTALILRFHLPQHRKNTKNMIFLGIFAHNFSAWIRAEIMSGPTMPPK